MNSSDLVYTSAPAAAVRAAVAGDGVLDFERAAGRGDLADPGLQEGAALVERAGGEECKGRISTPDAKAKSKAKGQAQRVVSIGGVAPTWSAGAITYFSGDVLRFYWEDPPTTQGKGIIVPADPTVWRHHYLPVLGLVQSSPDGLGIAASGDLVSVPEADVEVGVHPRVLDALLEDRWDDARAAARQHQFVAPFMADGLAVIAGRTWMQRYHDPGAPFGRRG